MRAHHIDRHCTVYLLRLFWSRQFRPKHVTLIQCFALNSLYVSPRVISFQTRGGLSDNGNRLDAEDNPNVRELVERMQKHHDDVEKEFTGQKVFIYERIGECVGYTDKCG